MKKLMLLTTTALVMNVWAVDDSGKTMEPGAGRRAIMPAAAGDNALALRAERGAPVPEGFVPFRVVGKGLDCLVRVGTREICDQNGDAIKGPGDRVYHLQTDKKELVEFLSFLDSQKWDRTVGRRPLAALEDGLTPDQRKEVWKQTLIDNGQRYREVAYPLWKLEDIVYRLPVDYPPRYWYEGEVKKGGLQPIDDNVWLALEQFKKFTDMLTILFGTLRTQGLGEEKRLLGIEAGQLDTYIKENLGKEVVNTQAIVVKRKEEEPVMGGEMAGRNPNGYYATRIASQLPTVCKLIDQVLEFYAKGINEVPTIAPQGIEFGPEDAALQEATQNVEKLREHVLSVWSKYIEKNRPQLLELQRQGYEMVNKTVPLIEKFVIKQ